MIDLHCHLLPQIDDGSDSEQKSLDQLCRMSEGGITDAFLTAHYIHGIYKYERSGYDAKLARLRELASANGIPLNLHQGFEVFIHPNSLQEIERDNLVLGNSRYVLIESDLNGLTDDFYNYVYPILRKGYRPILAHAERFVSIMQKPHDAKKLIDRDLYLQINAGSLTGQYGEKVRQTAWVLLRNGWAHFIASDDHARMPYDSYFEALKMLRGELDEETAKLLSEDFPRMVLNNQTVPHKYVYLQHTHERHRRKKKSLWRRIFG